MTDEAQEPPEVDLSPRRCPKCSRSYEATTDQGLSVDVHEECLACWGPRLHGTPEAEERFKAMVAEGVRRGWIQPPPEGEGAELVREPNGEIDVGSAILQRLDMLLADRAMMRRAMRAMIARVYSKNPPPLDPELIAWLGIEVAPAEAKSDIMVVGPGFSVR